jgi:hypothetical protein
LNLFWYLRLTLFGRFKTLLRSLRGQALADLRRAWGKPVARERDMEQITRYHDLVAREASTVDQATWQDLAMDELFAKVDRTASLPGRQILYHQMRTYVLDDAVLAERARQYRLFRSEAALREPIQRLLGGLDGRGAAWLAPLLVSPLPEKPRYAWLLYLASAFTLGCLVGMVVFPPLFLLALGLVLFNLVINETYGRRITPHFSGFAQLDKLLGACRGLAQIPDDHDLPQLREVRALASMAATLRKRFGWLARDRTRLSDMGAAMIGLLNICFLFDILVFLRSLKSLRQHQAELVELLEAVGSLDAAISVASYLDGLPCATVPVLVTERRIDVRGLYHPLIEAAVGNPLELNGRSALITGSNMAGKTTFIRTVGINVLLAQTLHICLAEQAILPRAIVQSSIRREDHLGAGKSYYFAEIERILSFIRASEEGPLQLFVIDEIFRGTNTVERIAGSAAVLRQLGQRHLALVTTHDLELQDLLGDSYAMFHFQEQVLDGGCAFDYRIQPGPARSRNAIRLLEVCGYPEAITRHALQVADQVAAGFAHGLVAEAVCRER